MMYIQCGLDEVGRGCLCGPVAAACVYFNTPSKADWFSSHLADSKQLSPDTREALALVIRKYCRWGIGWAYPHEIDRINIHNASLLAMKRAFTTMHHTLSQTFRTHITRYKVLVDGKFSPQLHAGDSIIETETIIKGDAKIDEIKAASILAKTSRDTLLLLLDRTYPQYGLAKHKGYPTPYHKKSLNIYGDNLIYRKSFKY